MIETAYLHLKFQSKNCEWSVNLPFVCDKCGVCCTLNDFLTAGPAHVNPQENPELDAKLKQVYEETGKRWEADEAKYEVYITSKPCPFLKEKMCSIYEVRPNGCRQFPNTPFGMLSQDCMALNRFKKQAIELCRGRTAQQSYHFTTDPIMAPKLTEKQYRNCVVKLQKAGVTNEELTLFRILNERGKSV